jgi:hypothetical protein
MEKTLYQECVECGILMRNHASDLYIPANEDTIHLLKKHNKRATTFINQVEGGLWFDVAFAFDPWWVARQQGISLQAAIEACKPK